MEEPCCIEHPLPKRAYIPIKEACSVGKKCWDFNVLTKNIGPWGQSKQDDFGRRFSLSLNFLRFNRQFYIVRFVFHKFDPYLTHSFVTINLQYSRRMFRQMNSPKVDTRSRESNSRSHD